LGGEGKAEFLVEKVGGLVVAGFNADGGNLAVVTEGKEGMNQAGGNALAAVVFVDNNFADIGVGAVEFAEDKADNLVV